MRTGVLPQFGALYMKDTSKQQWAEVISPTQDKPVDDDALRQAYQAAAHKQLLFINKAGLPDIPVIVTDEHAQKLAGTREDLKIKWFAKWLPSIDEMFSHDSGTKLVDGGDDIDLFV